MTHEATCGTCPWFKAMERIPGTDKVAGQCKADPPKLIPGMVRAGGSLSGSMDAQFGYTSAFPGTTDDDWCRLHPERIEPLKYDRNQGFNRTPTLAEAKMFAVTDEENEAMRALSSRTGGENDS